MPCGKPEYTGMPSLPSVCVCICLGIGYRNNRYIAYLLRTLQEEILMDTTAIFTKEHRYAVIGATPNEQKYGHTVCCHLLEKGYHVIPINPKYQTICKQIAYPDILSVPDSIDVVVMVVPPETAKTIMPMIIEQNIPLVWFQPGSADQELIEICKKHGITAIHNSCIMVKAPSLHKGIDVKTDKKGDKDDD